MLQCFNTEEPKTRKDRLGNKIPNKKVKTRSKMQSTHVVTWSDEIRVKIENQSYTNKNEDVEEKLESLPIWKNINFVETHKTYNSQPADKYDYGLLKDKNTKCGAGNASCAPVQCSIF